MANGVQFFTNIGWAFLILSLPDYLKKVMHLDDGMTGLITTGALTIGIAALPIGGLMTDYISRGTAGAGPHAADVRDEIRAAGCYLLALSRPTRPGAWRSPLELVTFFADIGLPAMWTLMQDISGKHQAQLFGWGNMWGNFGAAIMPMLFTAVLKAFDTNHDFHEGVWLCAGAFVLAGCLRAVRERRKARDAGECVNASRHITGSKRETAELGLTSLRHRRRHHGCHGQNRRHRVCRHHHRSRRDHRRRRHRHRRRRHLRHRRRHHRSRHHHRRRRHHRSHHLPGVLHADGLH
jgi:MFS family permease